MSDQHYVHKALSEVLRLADEKLMITEEVINKREEELRETSRSCEETVNELGYYFSSLSKQLERWKMTFVQDIQKGVSEMQTEFRSTISRIQHGLNRLKELRETSAEILTHGHCSSSDLVYQVHSCIFSINQDLDALSEFVCNSIPLKFVGKLNFDAFQKGDIGTLERLSDTVSAEILPSKLPKIKLGRLFHLDFQISKKYCEAARKFITYSVTKDEEEAMEKVCAYLQDNKNGTYTLSFPITVIVPHTVNVCYLGEHIRNSPYTIAFKVDPNQVGSGTNQTGASMGGFGKESTNEGQSSSNKPIGRAMGDDREICKRNKWQGGVESTQQNNNCSANIFDQQFGERNNGISMSHEVFVQS